MTRDLIGKDTLVKLVKSGWQVDLEKWLQPCIYPRSGRMDVVTEWIKEIQDDVRHIIMKPERIPIPISQVIEDIKSGVQD